MPIEERDHAHGQVVLGRHGVCVCQCREIRVLLALREGYRSLHEYFFHLDEPVPLTPLDLDDTSPHCCLCMIDIVRVDNGTSLKSLSSHTYTITLYM